MATQLLAGSDEATIVRAVAALRRGALVAFPTDTVYGVGALAWDPTAVASVFTAKGREMGKAVPLLLAGSDQLEPSLGIAGTLPAGAAALARRFWPGPLTLVVPRGWRVPDEVTGGGTTVALRVPDHPVALSLLAALGEPLATSSANRSGGPDPWSAEDVLDQLGGRIDLVIDGGTCPGGSPSTVLDLTTQPWRIVRAGPVSLEQIEQAVG